MLRRRHRAPQLHKLVGDRLIMQGACTYTPTRDDFRIPQCDCVPGAALIL